MTRIHIPTPVSARPFGIPQLFPSLLPKYPIQGGFERMFGPMTNLGIVLRKARRSESDVRGQDCMVLRRVQGQ